jgi:hypothetical protein
LLTENAACNIWPSASISKKRILKGNSEKDFPSLKSLWISFLLFNLSSLLKVNFWVINSFLKDENVVKVKTKIASV